MSDRMAQIKELSAELQSLERPWDEYGDDAVLRALQNVNSQASNDYYRARNAVRNALFNGEEPSEVLLQKLKDTKAQLDEVVSKIEARQAIHQGYREQDAAIRAKLQKLVEEQLEEYDGGTP